MSRIKKPWTYEKYLRGVPRHVPFNPYTRSSRPSTFLRSHPSTQPANTTSPLGSIPSASSTNLAKTTTRASSSARSFTSQIECHHCHAKGHIASRCPQHALLIDCVDDYLLEDIDQLLVVDPLESIMMMTLL